MKKRHIVMTEGPIVPSLIAFTIPLLLSGLLQTFFHSADTIVVGRFAGHRSMAAIGGTNSITNLLVNFFLGLSVGVNVSVGRALGGCDRKGASKAAGTALTLALLSGIFLSVTGLLFTPMLLRMIDTPADIIPLSTLYMRIIFLGESFSLLYNFGAAVLRASGDTSRPLFYLFAAGIVNVVLNLFFVIVLHMDVAGVALATILSQALSAFLVVRVLVKGNGDVKLEWENLVPDRRRIRDIIRTGVPAGLQSVVFGFSNVLVQSSVNSFGSIAVAGNTAAVSIDGMMYTVNNCLSQANLSFVSQNYGAGKKDRVLSVMKASITLAVLTSAVLSTVCLVFGPSILGLFSTDSMVVEYGMYRVRWVLTVYFLFSVQELEVSCLRGLGFSFSAMVASLFAICGVRTLWILTVFASIRTLPSLYMCYPLSWVVAALIEGVMLVYVWKRRNPLDGAKKILA